MSARPIVVLKLGGSVLRSERDLPRAVSEVYRCWRKGAAVLAVVSALGDTTEELLQRAEQLGLPPRSPAFPAYLGGGEHAAASLLTLALHRAGLPATLLDAVTAGLLTAGDPRDAAPIGLDREGVLAALAGGIAVLPGFVGRDAAGAATLLGRGGSDLTALFVAAELGAACTLLKDVGGLYTADPAREAGCARRFATLSWATARTVAGGAVQEKALALAQARGLTFLVRAPGGVGGTRIGDLPDRLEPLPADVPPLRVALLGCGAVGGGVLHHLLDRRRRFTLVGVAVRDRRGAPAELPAHLLVTPEELAARPADVLVEVAGGTAVEPWIAGALACGRHAVTANKALLAERGAALRALAEERDVSLRTSAAVGGALPALEAVGRLAKGPGVRALRGVLNGTSSFVLDRLAAGDSLAAAVVEARRRGFAEADPSLDLDGSDAAQKLVLLAREAWGRDLAAGGELDWQTVPRQGIDEASVAAGPPGAVWRLVARASLAGGRLELAVAPEPLPADDFLATTAEAGNALEVVSAGGDVLRLTAQGAGRWPTAEAVLADLEELWREHAATFDAAGATAVPVEVPLATAGEVAP